MLQTGSESWCGSSCESSCNIESWNEAPPHPGGSGVSGERQGGPGSKLEPRTFAEPDSRPANEGNNESTLAPDVLEFKEGRINPSVVVASGLDAVFAPIDDPVRHRPAVYIEYDNRSRANHVLGGGNGDDHAPSLDGWLHGTTVDDDARPAQIGTRGNRDQEQENLSTENAHRQSDPDVDGQFPLRDRRIRSWNWPLGRKARRRIVPRRRLPRCCAQHDCGSSGRRSIAKPRRTGLPR